MFYVFEKITWFFKENKKRFLLIFVSLIIANALSVLIPKFIGSAIDLIEMNRMSEKALSKILFAILCITTVEYIANYLWSYHLFERQICLEGTLRERLFHHILKLSSVFYEKNKTGDLMAKVTNDIGSVGMAVGYGLLTLLDSTLYMGTILGIMIGTVSFKLTLATIIPLPLLIYAAKVAGKKIDAAYEEAQKSFGELNYFVLENVSGVRMVRSYVLEELSEKNFSKKSKEVCDKNIEVAKVNSLFYPLTKTVTALSYMIALFYGAILIQSGEISLGDLVSFNIYLNMLIWPMIAIGEFINVIERGNASMKRLDETLQYQPDMEDKAEVCELKSIDKIKFVEYSFQYPLSEKPNISNLTFQLNRGETLGIVGKTGSGKSTIIKCLLGEYPNSGNGIYINEYPKENYARKDFLSKTGYVPQEHILFSKTVEENIRFGNVDATREQVNEAVICADLQKDMALLSDGLQTLIGEKGISVSGGQKQRISIARAIIKEPEILILDDSLSAVDAKTEQQIIQNIQENRRGKTNIIVSHRISAIMNADHILVMENGHCIEQGTHEELIKSGGWYFQVFQVQNAQNDIL